MCENKWGSTFFVPEAPALSSPVDMYWCNTSNWSGFHCNDKNKNTSLHYPMLRDWLHFFCPGESKILINLVKSYLVPVSSSCQIHNDQNWTPNLQNVSQILTCPTSVIGLSIFSACWVLETVPLDLIASSVEPLISICTGLPDCSMLSSIYNSQQGLHHLRIKSQHCL